MSAAELRQRAEEAVRLHLRVISDWMARPRECPVEPHLLDELARDVVTDVLQLAGILPTEWQLVAPLPPLEFPARDWGSTAVTP